MNLTMNYTKRKIEIKVHEGGGIFLRMGEGGGVTYINHKDY